MLGDDNLPVWTGDDPLPYMNGYRFKLEDGRIGQMVLRDCYIVEKKKLREIQAMYVQWDDEK